MYRLCCVPPPESLVRQAPSRDHGSRCVVAAPWLRSCSRASGVQSLSSWPLGSAAAFPGCAGGRTLRDPGNRDSSVTRRASGVAPGQGEVPNGARPASSVEGQSKYLRPCRLHGLCLNYPILSLWQENSPRLRGDWLPYSIRQKARYFGAPGFVAGGGGWGETRPLAPEQERQSRAWGGGPGGSSSRPLGQATCSHRGIGSALCAHQEPGTVAPGRLNSEEKAKEKAAQGSQLCRRGDASPGPGPWIL